VKIFAPEMLSAPADRVLETPWHARSVVLDKNNIPTRERRLVWAASRRVLKAIDLE
jgi:hypothetical protein